MSKARATRSIKQATVIGLNGIGRQVAVHLAGLGIPRLVLIDPGIVSRVAQAAEGYARDDVGWPRVHVTAHRCHQVNPRLEIVALSRRGLQNLDLGEAVFYCSPAVRRPREPGGLTGGRIRFVAQCRLVGRIICLDFAVDNDAPAEPAGRPDTGSPSRRAVLIPIPVATVAAGLLVAEFLRFAAGQYPARAIRFDPRLPALKVERRP